MKYLKQSIQYLGIIIILPVITAGLLGILLSPLQSSARHPKPIRMLEANDIALDYKDTSLEKPTVTESLNLSEYEAFSEETDEICSQPEKSGDDSLSDKDNLYSVKYESADEGVNYAFALNNYNGDASESWYSSDQLRESGVIYDGERYYTWYSEKILPGEGLNISGRHVSDEGYIVDEYDRIVVASCMYAYQEEIDIPFGNGRAVVLDYCPARNVIDIYTNF